MSQHQTVSRPITPNPGMRRRIRLLMFTVLCLLVWVTVTVWDQTGKLGVNAGKLNALNLQKTAAIQTNADLKREVARLNDPEYRQEIARKQLHLGKSGETTFDLPQSNP
jgi:cell division protein DivIC